MGLGAGVDPRKSQSVSSTFPPWKSQISSLFGMLPPPVGLVLSILAPQWAAPTLNHCTQNCAQRSISAPHQNSNLMFQYSVGSEVIPNLYALSCTCKYKRNECKMQSGVVVFKHDMSSPVASGLEGRLDFQLGLTSWAKFRPRPHPSGDHYIRLCHGWGHQCHPYGDSRVSHKVFYCLVCTVGSHHGGGGRWVSICFVASQPRDLDTHPATRALLCLLGLRMLNVSSESGTGLTTKTLLCRVGAMLNTTFVCPSTSCSQRCDLFQCPRETDSLLSSSPWAGQLLLLQPAAGRPGPPPLPASGREGRVCSHRRAALPGGHSPNYAQTKTISATAYKLRTHLLAVYALQYNIYCAVASRYAWRYTLHYV